MIFVRLSIQMSLLQPISQDFHRIFRNEKNFKICGVIQHQLNINLKFGDYFSCRPLPSNIWVGIQRLMAPNFPLKILCINCHHFRFTICLFQAMVGFDIFHMYKKIQKSHSIKFFLKIILYSNFMSIEPILKKSIDHPFIQ